MSTVLPDGLGVKCLDCKSHKRISDNPPSYQEEDARLSHIFFCPKQPLFKRFHEDLVHSCAKIEPSNGNVETYPLPSSTRKFALEQAAVDPGNDRISAGAQADALAMRGDSRYAWAEIEKAKASNLLFGTMIEKFYQERQVKIRMGLDHRFVVNKNPISHPIKPKGCK